MPLKGVQVQLLSPALMSENNQEIEPVNDLKPLEEYLPERFNLILFQGTTKFGSDKVKNNGLRIGSLTSDITTASGYSDGNYFATPFNVTNFKSVDFSATQFELNKNLQKSEPIENVPHDRDGAGFLNPTSQYSRCLVESGNITSFYLSPIQIRFMGAVNLLFHGSYSSEKIDMEVVSQISGLFKSLNIQVNRRSEIPSDYGFLISHWRNWDIADKQLSVYASYLDIKNASDALGIPIEDLSSPKHTQEIFNNIGGEDKIIEFLAKKFPGKIKFNWNNLNISQEELVKSMIDQIYKARIANVVAGIHHSKKSDSEINSKILNRGILLSGSSKQLLEKLISDLNSAEYKLNETDVK